MAIYLSTIGTDRWYFSLLHFDYGIVSITCIILFFLIITEWKPFNLKHESLNTSIMIINNPKNHNSNNNKTTKNNNNKRQKLKQNKQTNKQTNYKRRTNHGWLKNNYKNPAIYESPSEKTHLPYDVRVGHNAACASRQVRRL